MTVKHLGGPQNISSTSTYISASHSVARNCEMHPESEGEWPQAILNPRRQLQCFPPLIGKFFDVSHLYLEHSYAIGDPLHNTSVVLRLGLALQSPLVPGASSPIHLTSVPGGKGDICLADTANSRSRSLLPPQLHGVEHFLAQSATDTGSLSIIPWRVWHPTHCCFFQHCSSRYYDYFNNHIEQYVSNITTKTPVSKQWAISYSMTEPHTHTHTHGHTHTYMCTHMHICRHTHTHFRKQPYSY